MRFDEIQRLKDDLARRIEEAKKEDAEDWRLFVGKRCAQQLILTVAHKTITYR